MASTAARVGATPEIKIPPLIKRNITLFALSQSFTGSGMQFLYSFGPLMVVALTGSAALAGLSVGLVGLSRFFVAYPVGKIADTYGRKPAILLGLTLALIGVIVTGLSMRYLSFTILAAGMLIFSMGMSAAQQLRVAATDMFPPWHRAQALGYVAMGSLVGLVVSPGVVAVAEAFANRIGEDALGAAWFLLPILILPGMVLISRVRPDPKEIGQHLDRYYHGYKPEPRSAGVQPEFSAWRMLRNGPILRAIVANTACQGNMSIVMVLTSLVLSHHGHSYFWISVSHMCHTTGMFAFTIPLGRLADRVGRERVMYPGVGVALAGAALVALTGDYWSVTLGTFLVGLGWAAANVSATAMIADHAASHERGRAIGVNESFAGGISVVTALITGPLIQWSGLPVTGLFAVVIAAPPLILLAAHRLRMDSNARAA
jgi:MFS family permease